MDLNEEIKRLYESSPPEVQKQFDEMQEKWEQAYILKEKILEICIVAAVPLDVLDMAADMLKQYTKDTSNKVSERIGRRVSEWADEHNPGK